MATGDGSISRKVFVGSVSYSSTNQSLIEFFSRYGPVESAQIMVDPRSGRSRGFAFVTFVESRGMHSALADRAPVVDGRPVDVKQAMTREAAPPPVVPRSGPQQSRNRHTPDSRRTLPPDRAQPAHDTRPRAPSGQQLDAPGARDNRAPPTARYVEATEHAPAPHEGVSSTAMMYGAYGGQMLAPSAEYGAPAQGWLPAPTPALSSALPTAPAPADGHRESDSSSSSPAVPSTQPQSAAPPLPLPHHQPYHSHFHQAHPPPPGPVPIPMGAPAHSHSHHHTHPSSDHLARPPHEEWSPAPTPPASAASDAANAGRRLFIGGLHFDADESVLAAHFSRFGVVESAEVQRHRETGRSRGFAFVTMANPAAAELALQRTHHEIMGRRTEIKLAFAAKKNPRRAHDADPHGHPGGPGAYGHGGAPAWSHGPPAAGMGSGGGALVAGGMVLGAWGAGPDYVAPAANPDTIVSTPHGAEGSTLVLPQHSHHHYHGQHHQQPVYVDGYGRMVQVHQPPSTGAGSGVAGGFVLGSQFPPPPPRVPGSSADSSAAAQTTPQQQQQQQQQQHTGGAPAATGPSPVVSTAAEAHAGATRGDRHHASAAERDAESDGPGPRQQAAHRGRAVTAPGGFLLQELAALSIDDASSTGRSLPVDSPPYRSPTGLTPGGPLRDEIGSPTAQGFSARASQHSGASAAAGGAEFRARQTRASLPGDHSRVHLVGAGRMLDLGLDSRQHAAGGAAEDYGGDAAGTGRRGTYSSGRGIAMSSLPRSDSHDTSAPPLQSVAGVQSHLTTHQSPSRRARFRSYQGAETDRPSPRAEMSGQHPSASHTTQPGHSSPAARAQQPSGPDEAHHSSPHHAALAAVAPAPPGMQESLRGLSARHPTHKRATYPPEMHSSMSAGPKLRSNSEYLGAEQPLQHQRQHQRERISSPLATASPHGRVSMTGDADLASFALQDDHTTTGHLHHHHHHHHHLAADSSASTPSSPAATTANTNTTTTTTTSSSSSSGVDRQGTMGVASARRRAATSGGAPLLIRNDTENSAESGLTINTAPPEMSAPGAHLDMLDGALADQAPAALAGEATNGYEPDVTDAQASGFLRTRTSPGRSAGTKGHARASPTGSAGTGKPPTPTRVRGSAGSRRSSAGGAGHSVDRQSALRHELFRDDGAAAAAAAAAGAAGRGSGEDKRGRGDSESSHLSLELMDAIDNPNDGDEHAAEASSKPGEPATARQASLPAPATRCAPPALSEPADIERSRLAEAVSRVSTPPPAALTAHEEAGARGGLPTPDKHLQERQASGMGEATPRSAQSRADPQRAPGVVAGTGTGTAAAAAPGGGHRRVTSSGSSSAGEDSRIGVGSIASSLSVSSGSAPGSAGKRPAADGASAGPRARAQAWSSSVSGAWARGAPQPQ